uniref:Transposase n=1 Tax=Peronospora matthiolae TaxID=2874970 RepID=A0AAV1TZZ0_9STRA
MLVKKMDEIEVENRRHAPTADRRDLMIVDAGRDKRAGSAVAKGIHRTSASTCVQHVESYMRIANAPWKSSST